MVLSSLCQLVSRDALQPVMSSSKYVGFFQICISHVLIGSFLSVSWCHVTRCSRCWPQRSGRAGSKYVFPAFCLVLFSLSAGVTGRAAAGAGLRGAGGPVQNMYFPRFDWSFSVCQLVSCDALLQVMSSEKCAGFFQICISCVFIGPFLSLSAGVT